MPARSRRCLAALIFLSAAPLTAEPSVIGTVFGPSGQPATGARVQLVPIVSNFEAGRLRLGGRRDPDPVAEGGSDAAGRFLLRAPTAGVFKVVARAEGRLPMQYAPLLLLERQELPPVTLAAETGDTRVVVQDAAGRPLAGVWVFAASSDERKTKRRAAAGWSPDFRVGRTLADGSISLPGRSGERLDVSVFPPGRAEVRRLDVEGGTITVPAGGDAAWRVRVVSLKGEPVAGVLVRAGDLAWPVGLTDADGRLWIPGMPGEAGKVWLVAPDGRQQVADLPAKGMESEVVLTLAAPVVVSGRILDQESAQPLSGALVSPGLDPGRFLLTDAGGRYRLVAPDPQGFPLQARAALHLPRQARVTSTHLRSGRAPTLALLRATALRGFVVDSQGTPLPGTAVLALPERIGEAGVPGTPGEDTGTSDGTGRFELLSLHAGSFYEVRAVRPGYLPASIKPLTPAPSRDSAPLKIVLSPARPVRGRVLDDTGRPVAGAEVRLATARAPGIRRPPKEPDQPLEEGSPFAASTDAQGRFLIARVPAERVDLTASRRGFATGRIRGIRIAAGVSPMELGTVVLKPGAGLHGRVVDRSGKPVSGAGIHLVETVDRLEPLSSQLDGESPEAVSRADGSFSLEDLPRDTPLHLLVRASGHLPAGVRGARAPAPEPLTVRLEPGALLRGRVMNEWEQPLVGARIVLTWQPSAPENPERQTGAPVERSDISGRDGRFEIRDAPAGTVRLSVTAEGYIPVEGFEAMVPWPHPDRELTLALSKGAVLTGRISTVSGQPVSGVRISAAEASSVSDDEGTYTVEGIPPGRTAVHAFHPAYKRLRREVVIDPGINPLDLTFEDGVEVTGRVVDSQGAPVTGARVALLHHVRGDWREHRERSGRDGTFRFSPVPPGRYRLQAGGEGYATAELRRPVLVAEEPLDGLEIVLEHGGTISGRILGLDADELARVEVEAHIGDEAVLATVDAGGRYEARHLRPGDYLLQAALSSGQRHVQVRVPLTENEEVIRDLEFAPGLTFSGRVLYDQEPLSEATISLRGHRLAVERMLKTDFQGAFRFEDLEPDTYRLGLSHSRELLVHNETLELTGDSDHLIQLRPARVSGAVIDAKTGRPIPGALIALHHVEGAEFLIADSAREDGTFSLHRVPAGGYRLTVRGTGYSPAEQSLAVLAGQDLSNLKVALTPTRGLELHVRLASGRVPDRLHLRVLGSTGALILTETRLVEKSGRIVLSTVPEGSWTLVLSAPGGAPAVIPVAVPGDPVAVHLPRAGHLRIRVPALASTDLRANATLSIANQAFWTVGPGGLLLDRWQLVGGQAVIEGVPAGLWQVRVETPDGQQWMGEVATPGESEVELVLN